jgi:hypothetical protein
LADKLLLSALEWLAAPTGTVQPAHGVGFTREERHGDDEAKQALAALLRQRVPAVEVVAP